MELRYLLIASLFYFSYGNYFYQIYDKLQFDTHNARCITILAKNRKDLDRRISDLLDVFYDKRKNVFDRLNAGKKNAKKCEDMIAEMGRLPETDCRSRFPITYSFLRAIMQQPTWIEVKEGGKINIVLYRKDSVKIASFLDMAKASIEGSNWTKGDIKVLDNLDFFKDHKNLSNSAKQSVLAQCEKELRKTLLLIK